MANQQLNPMAFTAHSHTIPHSTFSCCRALFVSHIIRWVGAGGGWGQEGGEGRMGVVDAWFLVSNMHGRHGKCTHFLLAAKRQIDILYRVALWLTRTHISLWTIFSVLWLVSVQHIVRRGNKAMRGKGAEEVCSYTTSHMWDAFEEVCCRLSVHTNREGTHWHCNVANERQGVGVWPTELGWPPSLSSSLGLLHHLIGLIWTR